MSTYTVSHKNNPSIKFEIKNPSFKYDKDIRSGDLEALKFVINYINYYNEDSKELDAPEYPLEHHINDIFKEEQNLFLPLLELENDSIEDIIKRIKFAKNIAYISEEIGYNKLFKKMAAIIAHYLNSNIIENE